MRTHLQPFFLFLATSSLLVATPTRWWPAQKAPDNIVSIEITKMKRVEEPGGNRQKIARNLSQEHMMAQSLAGLAAQAVNEDRGNELIYLNLSSNKEYTRLREEVFSRTSIRDRGFEKVWDTVKRYADSGIVKGYILYSWDQSDGDITTRRKNSDESCNVASSLAGLFQGIIVSEGLEEKAKSLGLKKLLDVRGKTESWLFENYKNAFNPKYLLQQDPKVPNNRAIAIAHKILTLYGLEAPTEEAYAQMDPLGLVFGWNDGHSEGTSVSQLAKYGHIICPSNWALNMPIFSILNGASMSKFKRLDPNTIDFEDASPVVSFYLSDGDNVQWVVGDFISNRYYWGSPISGNFPMTWGLPLADLSQIGIDTYQSLQGTQAKDSSIVLMPGYTFPDEFGIAFSEKKRKELLTQYAHRIEHYLQETGIGTISFLSNDYDSDKAMEAYQIFAKEIPSLLGMLCIDYAPYEKGDGKVFWFPNSEGVDIPVVTAKYSLWANLNNERSGSPAKIARLINEDSLKSTLDGSPYHNWISVHAWSGFYPNSTDDETVSYGSYKTEGTEAGMKPIQWTIDRLKPHVKTVCSEEMIWRIRMQHQPEKNIKIIKSLF